MSIKLEDVQRGYDAWASKPHNAKWVRKIDGTPIPNDIVVNIFEALKDIDAESAALIRSLRAEREVRVKPLEWEELTSPREDGPPEPTGDIEAASMIGEYSVCFDEDEAVADTPWCSWGPNENIGHFDTLEAAKAAAQADYDTRIRSAIEHVPPSEDDLVTPAYMAGIERGKDRGIAIGREQAAVIAETDAAERPGSWQEEAGLRIASAIRAAKDGDEVSRLFGKDFITQKYLRRFPESQRARSWAGVMVHIQTENGVWRTGGCGYTWAGKPDAWIIPFEDAVKKIAHCGPEKMGRFIRADVTSLYITPAGRKALEEAGE